MTLPVKAAGRRPAARTAALVQAAIRLTAVTAFAAWPADDPAEQVEGRRHAGTAGSEARPRHARLFLRRRSGAARCRDRSVTQVTGPSPDFASCPADWAECRLSAPSRVTLGLATATGHRPAASRAAMSIFRIVIIAAKARCAIALSRLVVSSSSRRGVICHEKPQRSLHHPQALSAPQAVADDRIPVTVGLVLIPGDDHEAYRLVGLEASGRRSGRRSGGRERYLHGQLDPPVRLGSRRGRHSPVRLCCRGRSRR